MKNLRNNPRNFAFALLVVCATITAPAFAGNIANPSFPVQMKCLVSTTNSPVFQLSFENATEQAFLITIKEKNIVVYTETLRGVGKNLVRKYQFVNEDGTGNNDDEISIEITSLKDNSTVTYRVHPNNAVEAEKLLVAAK